jgi:hypothetical protein
MATLQEAREKAKQLRKTLRAIDAVTRQGSGGNRHRDRMAERSRELSSEVSDIGDIPPIKDPARRDSCRLDLERFLVTYFPHSTGLSPFSADHRRVIARNQAIALEGGRVCNIVYRGFAKTTIAENTAIWATLYGHRKFVPVFGSDAGAAERIIDSIKMELETNELLYEDFPEVCHAIVALDGKPQRQNSQHHHGKRTFIEFTARTVVLPTIEGSAASGAILTSVGLTAATRGMKYKRADGSNVRPDFVIIDDPQTDESAGSPLQVNKRMDIIRKSILKLAGHRNRIACIVNATIIQPDDLADQLSDHARNPAWQSERIPMIRKWADAHDTLWMVDYAKLRTTYDPDDLEDQNRAHAEATAFYVANREAMDAGCEVSWASCYDEESEVSAIQHAYNILIDDGPDVFASECQNNPSRKQAADIVEIRPADVVRRVNGLKRGVVPLGATTLVGHIDVQHSLLYWTLFACDKAMTGSVIAYGTFPEQPQAIFALREAKRKLGDAYPGTLPPAAVEQGLRDLTDHLFGKTWLREDGIGQPLELVLIDWSDGAMAEAIAKVCRTSQHKSNLMPVAGVGLKPGQTPMAQFALRPGERRGRHYIENRNAGHAVRSIRADANYWKSRASDALTCPATNPGAITLYGGPTEDHRMIADHYASESHDRQTSESTGATVDIWSLKPNRENHYFDNLYNCLVAACVRGCGTEAKPKKERITLSQMMAKR